MTVIVGVVDEANGRVHLAADSLAVGGDGLRCRATKLVELPLGALERAVLGFAGFAALGPLAARHLKLDVAPIVGEDDVDAWAQATAEAITEIAAEHTLVSGEDDGRTDWEGLLAWRGRLWQLGHHVALPIDTYAAGGSGAGVALGAMWALHGTQPASVVAERAVLAAIAHQVDVGPPVLAIATGED